MALPHRSIDTGTEVLRSFLPAKDFALSREFYLTLGFTPILDAEVVIFRIGTGEFILQDSYEQHWAENTMMQLVVEDLKAWWSFVQSLELPKHFGVPEPRPPERQPWGLTVSYFIDPSHVLWHVVQHPGIAQA